jgi:hypothetical protein
VLEEGRFVRKCRSLLFLLVVMPLTVAGCREDDKIETRTVDHPEREKIRMLAAILPHGERTWFVKLSGSEAALADQKKPFDDFVKSVRFDDKKKPPIKWTTPEGWTEEGKSKIGGTMFRVDAGRQPLYATLTVLDKFGTGENTLEGNVNRWRGQINLPPADAADLASVTRWKIGDDDAYLVDLAGMGSVSKGSRPMADAAPQRPAHGGFPDALGKQVPFRFEAPQGWTEFAKGDGVTVTAYAVVEGKERAEVTLSSIPGDGGGVLANLKRWRQNKNQANLPPIPDAEIMRQSQELEVAGIKATYADFAGDRLRILGVIVPREGLTWFVKMTGPPELVGRKKAQFEAFVKSFQLDTE